MRGLAPPPPMKAPHLWRTAAERDERVGTMSLPGSPSRGAVLVAAHVRTHPRGRTE